MPDVKPLTSDYLKLWVDSWSHSYPEAHNAPLAKLHGLPYFTIEQMAALVDWKYPPPLTGRRRVRHERIRGLVENNSEQAVIEATAAAFAEADDERALKLLTRKLSGVGMAIGSTALMTHDPARFTVYDGQSSKSLRALNYLAKRNSWIDHLRGCRAVAADTGHRLRTVDQALFTANGRLTLPGFK
jgi:hypothetical protein